MTAQIIFFTAVALFIILLLRRGVALERIWVIAKTSALFLSQALLRLMGMARSKLGEGARNLRMPRSATKRPKVSTNVSPEANQHEFWREEMLEERGELMTHYDEGETLFRAGKLEEAEKFFLRAATRNPRDAKVYARLGLIYLQRKNYSDAIEALKVAVKLDKYNPSRHYNLALAYTGKDDHQRAIATIREAISLDPVSPKYRTLLEQLLNKK